VGLWWLADVSFNFATGLMDGFDFMGLCGYGFARVGLWWLGFVDMGLPAWVCGDCGLRWVGFDGHGFWGSVMKVFQLWAWGVRWIWVAGDEGVLAWGCW
jgi:hypothetical protein